MTKRLTPDGASSATRPEGEGNGLMKPYGRVMTQSVAPAGPQQSDADPFKRIENSLIAAYLESDSYMAKAGAGGMTNTKALSVRES